MIFCVKSNLYTVAFVAQCAQIFDRVEKTLIVKRTDFQNVFVVMRNSPLQRSRKFVDISRIVYGSKLKSHIKLLDD